MKLCFTNSFMANVRILLERYSSMQHFNISQNIFLPVANPGGAEGAMSPPAL